MIHAAISNVAASVPSIPALISGGVTWTFDQLDRNVNAVANSLLARGVRSGDVVIYLTNQLQMVVAGMAAASKIGVVPLLVQPGSPYSRVRAIHDHSGAILVIEDMIALYEGSGEQPDTSPRDKEQVSFLFHTSGTTTGLPRLSAVNTASMGERVRRGVEMLRCQPGDVVACSMPPGSAIGARYVYAALASGACVLADPLTEASMATAGVTHLVTTGDQFTALITGTIYGVPTLKRVIASTKGSDGNAAAFRDLFKVPFTMTYGLSEAGTILSSDGYDNVNVRGVPISGVEVKIVNGQLFVRTKALMSGYWANGGLDPIETDADGYWATGDLVREEQDGYVFLGRAAG
jgi:O-succinylbenzoic acid--CoA ligase